MITTVSQEARSSDTAMYVGEVSSVNAERVPAEAAEAAVGRLREMSADLRGCALVGPGGEVLAATGDVDRWGTPGAELLAAADAAGDEPASQVHVTTEDGEVFAVRHDDLAMVAVTERFTLASLMLFDMRAVLRDLARESA
jgi:predicted regulator of Ras-like GTPase activity (Roadblock/LC7/MglB family)